MEQTKVNPVIECFVSHGPINQLSFFYVLYETKSEPSVKMTDGSLSKS
ncbi:hypothetical protein ACMDXX_002402 [Enterococcus faecalis]|nr:hypothetical protein [Enterococcus faecalis]EGS8239466.1 hypothetical protein [Enterococcus faecalis]